MKPLFALVVAGGLLTAVGGCLNVQPRNPDPPPPQPARTNTPEELQRLAAREQALVQERDRLPGEIAALKARKADLERMRKER